MNLSPKLADAIAARYWRRIWPGRTEFETALDDLLRRDGLSILTDAARRDLILTLGDSKRRSTREFFKREAKFAAMRAATELPALAHAAE